MTLQKNVKRRVFWILKKRKKRILELWASVIENKPSLRNNIASHHRAGNTVELLSLILKTALHHSGRRVVHLLILSTTTRKREARAPATRRHSGTVSHSASILL